MSWYAAMSLEAAEFEALDLACRHYVDLGQVLGLPAADAEALLDRARQNLERALGAEILAGRGPACPDRDAMLAGTGLAGTGLAGTGRLDRADGRRGPLRQARERVLEHAAGCATCGPEVPRNVSATRIFALLPAPALTAQDRAEVLTALAGPQPPAAPALAQAALVPAPAASGLAPALPGPVPAASASVPVPAEPASAPVVPAPGQSALGPSLASYVRAPEPVRVPVASAAAPAAPVPAPAASSALTAPVAPAGPGGPAPAASGSSSRGASRPRRVHRGRLLIAGAGVLVSGVVIASAIAMAGPGQSAATGCVTPALAAGAATGPALQAAGLGGAGPVSSRAPSGAGAARPAGSRPSTPPPLVSTTGSKNQVMITAATQPLPPGQDPGARPNAGAPGGTGSSAAPAALQLSAGGVILGAGNAGQITLTATGGTVSWSASTSPPDQVSLSSYGGTLQAGQSVTVLVQVSRGSGAGSGAISFQIPGSDTEVIPVTWSAQPDGSGPSWHPRPSPPGPSPSAGSMSGTTAPNPSSLGPARWHRPRRYDPDRSRSGRP